MDESDRGRYIPMIGVASENPSLPPGVSPTDVNTLLEKILATDVFAHSHRSKEFLRYVVSHMLSGDVEQIKEYSIALEVFDRQESFDPRIDPVVRVEAHRLRAKLQLYREKQARNDRLILEIPKGSYIPTVRKAVYEISGNGRQPLLLRNSISIGVLPLLDLRHKTDQDLIADSLTEELIHKLTDEPGVQVSSWTSVAQFKNHKSTIQQIARRLQVGILLEGSLRQIEQSARVKVRIINVRSGFSLGLGAYDREMNELLVDQQELATVIVADLRTMLIQSENADDIFSADVSRPFPCRRECR